MKKENIFSLITTLVIICIFIGMWIFINKNSDEQLKLNQSKNSVTSSVIVDENGSPIFVNGNRVNTMVEKDDDVYEALDELSKMYGFDSSKQVFNILSINESEEFRYYKVQQKYNGVPVYGKQLVVTVNSENKVVSVTGNYYKDLNVSTYGSLSIDEAKEKLKEYLNADYFDVKESSKYIYIDDEENVYYSYVYTTLTNVEYADYVIDAKTGKVIDKIGKQGAIAEEVTAKGADGKEYTITLDGDKGLASSYHFYDPNRNITIADAYGISLDFGNPNDIKWINTLTYLMYRNNANLPIIAVKDKDGKLKFALSENAMDGGNYDNRVDAAVVAMYNYSKTYDYYKNVLGRRSFDNNGAPIIVNIGVQKDVISFKENNEHVNACWMGNDLEFYFGSSNGLTLAAGLDIVAHEFTHAVTQYTADLEYKSESGALNEAYSDILGSLVEGKNFEIGENVIKIRDMARPNDYTDPAVKDEKYYFPTDLETYNSEWQAKIMKNAEEEGSPLEKWQDWDNGGVHTNSGVPNHAAYLMYKNGAFDNMEQMAKVWYNSLFMLTSTSDFEDCAYAVIQTAVNLGLKEDKIEIIKEAFYATKMLEDNMHTLSGVVTDKDKETVISSVQVNAVNKLNAAINYEVFTDKEGKYLFTDLPSGDYEILFDKAKYEVLETDIELKDDKENFDVELVPIEENDSKKSEVVFVMDISASMEESDPVDVRKRIIVNILSSMDNKSSAALVIFAKGASVVNDGLSEKAISKKVLMTDVFNISNDSGYSDNSGTNGIAGLRKAISLFDKESDARKYIVFLTDGQDNVSEEQTYSDLIEKAKNKDIRILTVGLGDSVDSTNLMNIASLTDGKYYYADSSTELYKFDYKIFSELE